MEEAFRIRPGTLTRIFPPERNCSDGNFAAPSEREREETSSGATNCSRKTIEQHAGVALVARPVWSAVAEIVVGVICVARKKVTRKILRMRARQKSELRLRTDGKGFRASQEGINLEDNLIVNLKEHLNSG